MKDDVCIGISNKLIQISPGVKDSSFTSITSRLMWSVPTGKKETVKHGDALGPWGLKKFGPKYSKGNGALFNHKEGPRGL